MGYPDQQLFQAVQPHLGPGEQVRTIAYGERGMAFWAKLVCFAAVVVTTIPGLILYVIWHFVALKSYVVALTDRRLLVMEVSGLTPKNVSSHPLPIQGRFSMVTGGYGLNRGQILEITGPQPLWVKFLNSSPTNLHNAMTLFQGLQQAAQMQGGWPTPQHHQLPPGGGYGPPPGGGYGPPPGGGYGPPPGGGYGPPPGGGYGPPPGGGYGR